MNKVKKEERVEKRNVSKTLVYIFSGDFLSRDRLIEGLPFLFFLFFLDMLYIANGYYAERTVRDLHREGKAVKELRSEYITLKTALNHMSKQSKVAKEVARRGLGLKESINPPYKIVGNVEEFSF